MLFLVAGLVLWVGVHWVPMMPDMRTSLVVRYGERTYKGAFSLISAAGLGLIIWGKSKADFIDVWQPFDWGKPATFMLMFAAVVLMISSEGPDNWFRRTLGHPLILAVEVWALAHLMANGDLASVVLFGGFLLWSVFAFASASRRKPPMGGKVKLRSNLVTISVACVVYAAILYGHEWFTGVRILP